LPGLPFQIYTECLEDQLAAEAKAASPFNFDQDDKENEVTNSRLEELPIILDVMSVVPASQYRRSGAGSHASHHRSPAPEALSIDFEHASFPYGLGGNDGAYNKQDCGASEYPLSMTVQLSASSEEMPRALPIEEPDNDIDSVIGPSSSISAGKVASVLGS
jgi:hypothetical protein